MARNAHWLWTMAAGSLLLTMVGASPASATNPAVIVGTAGSDVVIQHGSSFSNVTAMSIPTGTWFVTATATVHASNYGNIPGIITSCRLTGGTDRDQGSWALTGDTQGRSVGSVLLTLIHVAGAAWSARLDCRTDAGTGDVAINSIRITALKGSTTTGSPRLHTVTRAASAASTGDGSFHSVLSLKVPPGRWWIVAKTNVANTYSSDTNSPFCQLKLGTDVDATNVGLYYPSQAGYLETIGVQVGHVFSTSTAGSAALQCRASHPFSTDHVRIIAVQAGKLVRKTFGGSSSSAGSGTPTVITGHADGPLTLAGGGGSTTLGTLALPAGRWLVSAKAAFRDGSAFLVSCRLLLGTANADQVDTRGGPTGFAGMYLQGGHVYSSPGTAKLVCTAAGTAGAVQARSIRITAVSASSLTQITLPV
jgi:hypothetical protein